MGAAAMQLRDTIGDDGDGCYCTDGHTFFVSILANKARNSRSRLGDCPGEPVKSQFLALTRLRNYALMLERRHSIN